MFRAPSIGMLMLLLGGSLLNAQDAVQSGPKKGAFMPKPFECYNVNGPAKGRPRCLVCKFGLNPAVLIFAKEPEDGKDEAFTDLLAKLDEAAADFEERSFQVGVVILSPDAHDSTNNAAEKDADAIIKEATNREKLYERLGKRAEKLKHVIIGAFPADAAVLREDPPKGYKLNPKAEMTVLFFERMKVIENYAFEAGALDAKQVEMMVIKIRDALPLKKKLAEEK